MLALRIWIVESEYPPLRAETKLGADDARTSTMWIVETEYPPLRTETKWGADDAHTLLSTDPQYRGGIYQDFLASHIHGGGRVLLALGSFIATQT